MTFAEYVFYLKSDLFRYSGQISTRNFISNLMFNPGFKYSVLMRTALYTKRLFLLSLPLHLLIRFILHHYECKYGISIPYNTAVGSGLYIGHFGGIVVHPDVRIGNNCNINHGVTIGATYGGRFPGVPTIGDCVYIAPGAKIIGGITVGTNVAIGANCVVTKPVPDNAVVVGVPGKVISFDGSGDYVVNTVENPELHAVRLE